MALFIISCVAIIVCSMSVGTCVNTAVITKQKDIGIKMSMGASRYNITSEFLLYAVVSCFMGISVTLIIMDFIMRIIRKTAYTGIGVDYSLIALSIFATIILTIIFSLLPSYKASKISPIKALNRE